VWYGLDGEGPSGGKLSGIGLVPLESVGSMLQRAAEGSGPSKMPQASLSGLRNISNSLNIKWNIRYENQSGISLLIFHFDLSLSLRANE